MQKILCKETRCHGSSVYQSVPSKCIHFLSHNHITSYLKMLQLSVFRILHWHKCSCTVRAALLLQEAPTVQAATSVQLQYASMHVVGKTCLKVCTIHKYPVSMMSHERTIHGLAEEHSITGSVPQKYTIQKLFHGWCMVYIKQEQYQAIVPDVGVKKTAMRSLLPITLMFSMCAQNSTVCCGGGWGDWLLY